MKVRLEEIKPVFKPVDVTFTIETLEDAQRFWAILNYTPIVEFLRIKESTRNLRQYMGNIDNSIPNNNFCNQVIGIGGFQFRDELDQIDELINKTKIGI